MRWTLFRHLNTAPNFGFSGLPVLKEGGVVNVDSSVLALAVARIGKGKIYGSAEKQGVLTFYARPRCFDSTFTQSHFYSLALFFFSIFFCLLVLSTNSSGSN